MLIFMQRNMKNFKWNITKREVGSMAVNLTARHFGPVAIDRSEQTSTLFLRQNSVIFFLSSIVTALATSWLDKVRALLDLYRSKIKNF